MPNWCENQLAVTGKKADVDKFCDMANVSGNFEPLETFLPTPKELLEYSSPIQDPAVKNYNIETYGAADWYDWRVLNWGTKWEVAYPDVVRRIDYDNGDQTIVFSFDTAWGPPIDGFAKIASQWKDLEFYLDFREPGMCFEGFAHYEDGEIVATETVSMYQKMDEYLERVDHEHTDYSIDYIDTDPVTGNENN